MFVLEWESYETIADGKQTMVVLKHAAVTKGFQFRITWTLYLRPRSSLHTIIYWFYPSLITNSFSHPHGGFAPFSPQTLARKPLSIVLTSSVLCGWKAKSWPSQLQKMVGCDAVVWPGCFSRDAVTSTPEAMRAIRKHEPMQELPRCRHSLLCHVRARLSTANHVVGACLSIAASSLRPPECWQAYCGA